MKKVLFYNEFMEESILQEVLGHKPKNRQPITLNNYELLFRGWKDSHPTIEYTEGKSVTCVVYDLSDKDIRILNEYLQCPEIHIQDTIKMETDLGDTELLSWRVRDIFPQTLPTDVYIERNKQVIS